MGKSLYNVRGGACPECGEALIAGEYDGCRSCGWSSLELHRAAARNQSDQPRPAARATEPRGATHYRRPEVRLTWRVFALIHGTVGSLLTSYGSAILFFAHIGPLLFSVSAVMTTPSAPGVLIIGSGGPTLAVSPLSFFLLPLILVYYSAWYALILGTILTGLSLGLWRGSRLSMYGSQALLLIGVVSAGSTITSIMAHGLAVLMIPAFAFGGYCLTASVLLFRR